MLRTNACIIETVQRYVSSIGSSSIFTVKVHVNRTLIVSVLPSRLSKAASLRPLAVAVRRLVSVTKESPRGQLRRVRDAANNIVELRSFSNKEAAAIIVTYQMLKSVTDSQTDVSAVCLQ